MGNLHTKGRCLPLPSTIVSLQQLYNITASLPPVPFLVATAKAGVTLIKSPVCYGMFSPWFTTRALLLSNQGLGKGSPRADCFKNFQSKECVNRYREKASFQQLCKHSQCDFKTSLLELSSLTLFFHYIHTPLSAYTYQSSTGILCKAMAKHWTVIIVRKNKSINKTSTPSPKASIWEAADTTILLNSPTFQMAQAVFWRWSQEME